MESLTFMQWLKTSKKNKNGLILQMIFALIFYVGVFLDDEMSFGWTLFVVSFTSLWANLAWLRVYLIWKQNIKNK